MALLDMLQRLIAGGQGGVLNDNIGPNQMHTNQIPTLPIAGNNQPMPLPPQGADQFNLSMLTQLPMMDANAAPPQSFGGVPPQMPPMTPKMPQEGMGVAPRNPMPTGGVVPPTRNPRQSKTSPKDQSRTRLQRPGGVVPPRKINMY